MNHKADIGLTARYCAVHAVCAVSALVLLPALLFAAGTAHAQAGQSCAALREQFAVHGATSASIVHSFQARHEG